MAATYVEVPLVKVLSRVTSYTLPNIPFFFSCVFKYHQNMLTQSRLLPQIAALTVPEIPKVTTRLELLTDLNKPKHLE